MARACRNESPSIRPKRRRAGALLVVSRARRLGRQWSGPLVPAGPTQLARVIRENKSHRQTLRPAPGRLMRRRRRGGANERRPTDWANQLSRWARVARRRTRGRRPLASFKFVIERPRHAPSGRRPAAGNLRLTPPRRQLRPRARRTCRERNRVERSRSISSRL